MDLVEGPLTKNRIRQLGNQGEEEEEREKNGARLCVQMRVTWLYPVTTRDALLGFVLAWADMACAKRCKRREHGQDRRTVTGWGMGSVWKPDR